MRAVDAKPLEEWYQVHEGADSRVGDLSLLETARSSVEGVEHVYNLAADMGGMGGFIENNRALCMLSVLTSTHVLLAAQEAGVDRYFYSSSLASTLPKKSRPILTSSRLGNLTHTPPNPRMVTAGRSSSANEWLGTSAKTSG